jgi:hypothetical protein
MKIDVNELQRIHKNRIGIQESDGQKGGQYTSIGNGSRPPGLPALQRFMVMVNQSAESEWRKKVLTKISLMKKKGENLNIMVQKHPIIHPCMNNIWICQIDSLRKSMICTEGNKSLFYPLMMILKHQ